MGITPQPVPTTYTLGNLSGFTPVSELFTFNIEQVSCRAGENVQRQFMWKNRYGHWDYYTFTAGLSEGVDIERFTMKQWNVDWGSQNPTWEQYSRGLEDWALTMTETHVANTGFLNQPDFMFLEELWTSNQVYQIRTDGGLTPINIISTEFIRKNKGNKDIVNLEITYVYSNNITLIGK